MVCKYESTIWAKVIRDIIAVNIGAISGNPLIFMTTIKIHIPQKIGSLIAAFANDLKHSYRAKRLEMELEVGWKR
jgi:hypothetical protein